jgi:hypothetical protein
LPLEAIDTMGSNNIILLVNLFNKTLLNDEQTYMVGNNSVYNIKLVLVKSGGQIEEIGSIKKSIKVEIPCNIASEKDADRITVFKVAIEKKPENLGARYDFAHKKLLFTTRSLGQFFYMFNDVSFNDIKTTQWVKRYYPMQ